jgi:phage N-6-adenine-methyltransferase
MSDAPQVRKHNSGPHVEDWGTPQDLYDRLNRVFHFDLDPCASGHEIAKAPLFFTPEDDGLKQEWTGNVFLNPPWGKGAPIKNWLIKAGQELDMSHCNTVVALLPASVGTNWFNDYVMPYAQRIWFVRGRLAFEDYTQASKHRGKKKANFDSIIVQMAYTDPETRRFNNPIVTTWRHNE